MEPAGEITVGGEPRAAVRGWVLLFLEPWVPGHSSWGSRKFKGALRPPRAEILQKFPYFCEIPALLRVSCVDTSHYEQGVDVSGIIFLLIPFSMISVSYVKIFHTVLQTRSSEARRKSFSTCSFHMVVVVMYYGPYIFTYMGPKSYRTPGQDKFLAMFYTILTPSLNPVIYSFRNKDVLKAMKNMLKCLPLAKK
ncbi:Olfactory receptor 2AJ1 [Heterocephalus glaber]|uniref:Olfactory receptor 2AJ1 n=1 Tax=Heterocephalus glaber TaxID=10181 RepID=G5C9C0_HETGA|nr:Olfactory receptor 2AJ1 [Heterocephalus glaber]